MDGAGRPFLWDAPFGAPRATNPDDGAGMLLRLAARPSLFGLAPGGVCPAAPVTRGAVRSCRAVSPLPAGRVAATCTGGLFSVALSLGSPPPDVIRHRIPVEPGLSSARSPGRARGQAAAVRPSGNESIAGNRGTGQASRRAFPASRRTADSRSRVPASASPVTASGRQ
jgi:hypothetical protein